MNCLVVISCCWLLKKTLVIATNLTNPESASARCRITRYSLQNSLVSRCCRSCSLQKITSYSLQNSLVTRCKKSLVSRCKIRSLLVAEVAPCKKSLVTRCKIYSLLVAEVNRCKNSLVARCKIRSLLVAEVESLFVTL